jgi:hypothetical protein
MELTGDLCSGREMAVMSMYCKADSVVLGSKVRLDRRRILDSRHTVRMEMY